MATAVIAALGILTAAVGSFVGPSFYQRLVTFGAFRSLENIHGSDLKIIPGTVACEDLHRDPVSGQLFTACQDDIHKRTAWFPPLLEFDVTGSDSQGVLVRIDPQTFKATRLRYKGFQDYLVPHGIDILNDPEDPSSIFIYVVSHLANPDYYQASPPTSKLKALERIEVFKTRVDEDEAVHVRSIQHPLIQTANDIAVDSPNSFYVTNDHKHIEGPLRVIEELGTHQIAAWSNTIHVEFDPNETDPSAGVTAQVALTGLHNNNGLGRGRPGYPEIMIADASGGVFYRARAHAANRSLEMLEAIQMDSTLDNPYYYHDDYATPGNNASGYILSGLAKAVTLMTDFKDPNKEIPVMAWHVRSNDHAVDFEKSNTWEKRLIFQDDGKTLRSASGAVLVGIDPNDNGGKKQGWLFVTGFASMAAVAAKIDL